MLLEEEDKIQLRNGQTTSDLRLDRMYQLDWRSLDYPVSAEILEQGASINIPRSYTWFVDEFLDQRAEGACVGFSFSHELAARPQEIHGINDNYARGVYFDAQRVDPWSGGAYPGATPFYEGTSVLAGAQVLKDRGFYESYHWALTAVEVAQGIGYFGPAVLGCDWYTSMFNTDRYGFIYPYGRVEGGHAILIQGVHIVFKTRSSWFRPRTWADVNYEKSYVILRNSWGPTWGTKGTAKLSLANLAGLLAQSGEVCFPKRSTKSAV